MLVASAAMVIVAAAVVAGVVASSSGPSLPGAGVAPADFVVSSTQTTMDQHTAAVTISGSVSADGHTVPLQGAGSADFDTNAFSADVSFTEPSGSLVEHELVVDQHFYFGIDENGSNLSTVTGGPEWIDVPVPDQGSSSLGAGNIDPLDQMKLLEQKGAAVVPLGGSTVDGTTVSGYQVTISRAQEIQGLQSEIQSGAIPQSDEQQLLNEVQVLGTPRMQVYFDGSGLLRRETVSLGAGQPGGTGDVGGTVQIDFSSFGSTADIVAPPANDIVSFTQFQQDAQAYEAAHQG